jgi:hypothetical protein
MNLLSYIQGNRKGKEAHRIEKEAMRDPFLADAIEGFDTVKADHTQRISHIRRRILSSTQHSGQQIMYMGIAASLLLCLTVGGYFLLNKQPDNLIARSELSIQKEAEAFVIEEEEILPAMTEIPSLPDGSEIRSESKMQVDATASQVSTAKMTSNAEALSIIESEDILDKQQFAQQEIYFVAQDAEAEISEDDVAVIKEKAMDVRREMAAAPARSRNVESINLSVPQPEIGMEAYEKYLKEAKLPLKDEKCANIQGEVEVEFTIKEGQPTHLNIKQNLCDEAGKEAIRLIENGCKWIGADGQKVVLKVTF